MGMYAKIRRMHFREGMMIREIQRRTSLSRTTIKKWLREPEGETPHYHRESLLNPLSTGSKTDQTAVLSGEKGPVPTD